MGNWTKKRIEKRLGGYKHLLPSGISSGSDKSTEPCKVAVIGGGLAGLSAGIHLAEKGVHVTLFESENYLGGKCGAWPHTLPDGTPVWVEHGFHAVFRQYYNCRELLDRAGVSKFYESIDDYLIVGLDHSEARFADIETTPVLNLLSLWRRGLYRMWDVISTRAIRYMPEFLKYDPVRTFERFDETSYDEFCEEGQIPEDLRFVFNTFARAFFAEGDRMSMAEVIKSFHFYFLSHDEGLLYEYLNDSYHHAFVTPLRTYFEDHGGTVRLGTPVNEMKDGDRGIVVNGEAFDQAILACDVNGVRSIVEQSESLMTQTPALKTQLAPLKASQRYCVLRLWMNERHGDDLPVFIITEKNPMLDSITFCHRAEKDCESWSQATGGGVYELHCYAVPDSVQDEKEAKELFMKELLHYIPALESAGEIDSYIQLNGNFSAFHRGMYKTRPTTRSAHERIKLAGDWVKLPCPAMLMEAAATSGVLAANEVLADLEVNAHPVYTVPLRGIMA